jgi:hypothetical protein
VEKLCQKDTKAVPADGRLGEFWNGLLQRLAEISRAKSPRDMPSHTNIHTVNPILKRF